MPGQKPIEISAMPSIDKKQLQKMVFIMNSLENGWTIKKRDDSYIFIKKHENKKEIFKENYLETFLIENSTSSGFLDA